MAAILGVLTTVRPLTLVLTIAVMTLVVCAFSKVTWIAMLPLAILIVSPSVIIGGTPAAGSFNADSVQKLVVLIGTIGLLASRNLCASRTASAAVLTFATFGLFAIADPLELNGVGEIDAARATVGFVLPWLLLYIRWGRSDAYVVLRFVSSLPLTCVLLGSIMSILGQTSLISIGDGTPRLQGASIPPHLAMLCFTAALAGMALIHLGGGERGVAHLLTVNVAILLLTGTRGAIIAISVLLLGFLFGRRGLRASPYARRTARLIAAVSILGIAALMPDLIERSVGNSYEGAINTSGRDAAWQFYLSLTDGHLYTGRGLGFSAIANQEYQPDEVQDAFDAPHNEYIHFLLDGGIPLLLSMTLLVFGALRTFTRQNGDDSRLRPVGMALLLAIAAYSLVDNIFSTPQFSIPLLLVVGASSALRKYHESGERAAHPNASRTK